VELAPIAKIVQQGEQRLKVWFADPTLRPDIASARLPGTRVVEQEPGVLHIAYQGPAGPILQWVSRFPVDRITTPQTSLQEAFLQYYEIQSGSAGGTRDPKGTCS
jgi:hypothetical protein